MADRFLKKLDKVIHKCFKKIRVTEKKDEEKEKLLEKWNVLRAKYDVASKTKLEKVEEELAAKYADENFQKIKDRTAGAHCEDGGLHPKERAISTIQRSPNCHDRP